MGTPDKKLHWAEWSSIVQNAIVTAAAEYDFDCESSFHCHDGDMTVLATVSHTFEDRTQVLRMVDFESLPEVLRYTITNTSVRKEDVVTVFRVDRGVPAAIDAEESLWEKVKGWFSDLFGLR